MRFLTAFVLLLAMASVSFGACSVKGGLAGGALRVSGTCDRPFNDKWDIGCEAGYGLGNGYNIMSLGVSGTYALKENLYAGVEASYSSYSSAVMLSLPSMQITEKSGVGMGAFIGMKRDNKFAQVGYDTRLGAVAEAGMIVRM
jgi:hypothetical protein